MQALLGAHHILHVFRIRVKLRLSSKSQKNIMKYKWYRQPTRCSNNGLLIIPFSSTCFGQLFCPSSGTLDCVLQLRVHCAISCNTQSSIPEDGQNNCPKHVELTGIINKPLLLYLVGCLYYLYQWCKVKQISDNEIYLFIKYRKSVLWRVAKCLSYTEDARCLKVKAAGCLVHGSTASNLKSYSLCSSSTAVISHTHNTPGFNLWPKS